MSATKRSGRVSKGQWLELALKTLDDEGIEAVRVERLAKKLGIAKSGFYWHFKDRRDLLNQLLEYWVHEFTEVVSGNPMLASLKASERLLEVSSMIDRNSLGSLDLVIRAWAKSDPEAEAVAAKVTQMRLRYIRGILEELGFEGDEAEMRTRLFVSYEASERTMFPDMSKDQRDSLRNLRMKLLMNRH